jgi:HEPN domain-containing protein
MGSLVKQRGRLQDEDEEKRTTALGIFHFGDSYWGAANVTALAKLRTPHADFPVCYLYYHAIELYLKAFLRLHGHSAKELRVKFGHSAGALTKSAIGHGLVLREEDDAVLALMAHTDAVIQSRYIQTGITRLPSFEALDRTCNSLRVSVGKAIIKSGQSVRRFRPTGELRG